MSRARSIRNSVRVEGIPGHPALVNDVAFDRAAFERLGRTSRDADAVQKVRPKGDRLIVVINRRPQAITLDQTRTMWNPGAKPGEFFGLGRLPAWITCTAAPDLGTFITEAVDGSRSSISDS